MINDQIPISYLIKYIVYRLLIICTLIYIFTGIFGCTSIPKNQKKCHVYNEIIVYEDHGEISYRKFICELYNNGE